MAVILNWSTQSGAVQDTFHIFKSVDGVNFSDSATVAGTLTTYTDNNAPAPGTYWYKVDALKGAGMSPFSNTASIQFLDPLAIDWANRVVANGGVVPIAAHQQAVSNLIAGLKTDGIWNKMIIIEGFVPGVSASIANEPTKSGNSMSTPILIGPGNDPWKDNTGNNFANGWPTSGHTYSSLNGIGTGVEITPGVTPTAIWTASYGASQINMGWTVYGVIGDLFSPGVLFSGPILSCDDTTNNTRIRFFLDSASYGGTCIFDCGDNNHEVYPTPLFGEGYYSLNRTSSLPPYTSSYSVYYASSNVPHTTFYTNNVSQSDPRSPCVNLFLGHEALSTVGCTYPFGMDTGAGAGWGAMISFAAMHQALTISESALLFNRVQIFRQAIGGGYI